MRRAVLIGIAAFALASAGLLAALVPAGAAQAPPPTDDRAGRDRHRRDHDRAGDDLDDRARGDDHDRADHAEAEAGAEAEARKPKPKPKPS